MGTRGLRNHNPLNIRVGNNWMGEISPGRERQFEVFANDAYGLRAGFIIIRKYINSYRCNTLRKIITRWAPPGENNTDNYINIVAKRSQLNPDERLVFTDQWRMCRLVKAMVFVESAYEPSDAVLNTAYEMAKG